MKIEIKKMKLSDLMPTAKNPRKISKEDLARLQKSVKAFPKMLDIREIVVDENNRILGGHQRVKALLANGETEVNVKVVSGLTEKEKDEFMIRDNVQNGEWDEDILNAEWDDSDLSEWGGVVIDDKEEKERSDIEADFDTLKIEIECVDETEQESLFAEFQSRGLKCRVI